MDYIEITSKGEKNAYFGQAAYKTCSKIILCVRFSTWKIWHLNQIYSKVTPKSKFPPTLGRKIDWDAKLFMYLTQHNSLGSAHEMSGIWTVPN